MTRAAEKRSEDKARVVFNELYCSYNLAQLTMGLAEGETDIPAPFVIKKLSGNVDELTQANQEKDSRIAQQQEEMAYLADQSHRAYYVIGSYDELKEKGVVNKEGGLLFKTQKATNNVNVKNFTLIDKNKVTSFDVNLRKARLISKHPEGSYEFVYDETDSKMVRKLVVKDVAAFWSNTDFLIVSTKR